MIMCIPSNNGNADAYFILHCISYVCSVAVEIEAIVAIT